MARAVRPGGTVACYVWDYAGGMQMMRAFWDAAVALEDRRRQLRERIKATLAAAPDGRIRLSARAFAIRGVNRAPER
jgi:hypothetical protein